MEPLIQSGELWRLLSRPRPSHLYHYTGPAGVIGILKGRALWAGRPADMNDSTEQRLAHVFAQESLSRLVFPPRSFGEGMVQYALENIAGPRTWGETSRAYTVSLTSEMDSLEQWRAYCPRSGGVALGFATDHLENVAQDQGFLLAPCTYDELTQRAVVEQIVKHHVTLWNERLPLDSARQGISSHLVRDFITDLERFAPLLKHSSFAAEKEWRLISPLVGEGDEPLYVHIAGDSGIKQFQQFSLLTDQHPEIVRQHSALITFGFDDQAFRPVIGPNRDPQAMEEAIRTLAPREFGWISRVERTKSPYR